eukprot:m.582836 g.582836  ORF g.582836 m.582836 type:complete len:165 (-) comp22338_c0_seq9:1368-1862(-)
MRSIQVLIACVRCFSISAHSISCAQPSTHPWHSDSRCCVRLTWVSSALIRLRVRGGRAGSAAGMVSQTIIYPMEVLKTRLALSQGGPYSSMASCLRTTVHNEGFGALYKGLAASNLGMIPYAGVDLAVCTNTTPCLLCDGVSAYVQPWFCGSNTRSNDVSCESI